MSSTGKQQTPEQRDIFRREAVDHLRAGSDEQGDVLRLSPTWLGWTYRLLVGLFAAALLFLCCGRMNEYAEGPAVVRADRKIDVTCDVSAVVRDVLVVPGQRVDSGQALVLLDDTHEQAAVTRYRQELSAAVAASLRDPADPSSRGRVMVLRSQLDDARRQLALRRLKAPASGIVLDVRSRPGQALLPGESVVTLMDSSATYTLVMVMPGRYRPQLRAGMPARLEIVGYPHSYRPVTVTRIADEIVGPAEARRYLGREIADAVVLGGPVVLAEGALTGGSFRVDGMDLPFADGLQGRVQVKIRSIPIILALVPGLRNLGKGHDHGFPD